MWAALAGVVALIVYGLRPQPQAVEIAAVTTGPLTVSVLEEGKTRIRHRYVVSAPVGGALERIPLRAGAAIEQGKTVLAIIRPTPASFLDPRAKAQADARLQMTEAARRQREAQLERSRASLELAQKEKARVAKLRRDGAVSARELDQATSQEEVLARELSAAQFALEVADFEIEQARAAARQTDPASDAGAEPVQVLAPVNGFVLNVHEESERTVTPGQPLLEVGDPADLEAEIELLSSDAVAVQPGAEVAIEQWGGEKPLRGKVSLIEPGGYTKVSSLGVEEQRVKARVDFIDPFPPGQALGDRFRVEARIVTWHADSVVQVPVGALFRRGGEWMTFLLEDGKARPASVSIGRNNGIAAEVLAGLTPGQQVILHPPDAVTDGAPVKPRK